MGKFCINRILPFTDSIIKTDSEGRYTDRNCLLSYLNGLESIGQVLM